MRIFILTNALNYGGAERVASLWANGLQEKGHEVFVITNLSVKIVYPLHEEVKVLSLFHDVRHRYRKYIGAIRLIRKYAKQYKPDIVLGVLPLPSFLLKIAILGLGIPVLATEHNSFERPVSAPMSVLRKFLKFILNRWYDSVTVITEVDRQIALKWYSHVYTLPNPLFVNVVEDVSFQKRKKIILAAGRLDDWYCKGFDLLLEAWGGICKQFADWKLYIAGTGSKQSQDLLLSLVKKYDLGNQVKFIGFSTDMKTFYQESSIFVLSSRYEGFGLVLTEAMSQGCACIACDYKGRQKEIITNEDEGLLCPVENVNALQESLLRLLQNDNLRAKLSMGATRRARTFELPKITDKLEMIIKDII